MFGRHDDLKEFAVVGPTNNRVADARRLDPARALYEALWANAFKVGLKPSFEAVDKLKLNIVVMSHAEFSVERRDHSDHMGVCKPICCGRDAEVAVGRIVPQAADLEVAFVQVTDNESLR